MLSSHTTFRPHADSAHVHAHVHNALQHCYANEQLRKPTFCITARSSANGHVTTASLKRFNATENSKTQTVFQHCYDEQLRGGGMRGEAGAALLRTSLNVAEAEAGDVVETVAPRREGLLVL